MVTLHRYVILFQTAILYLYWLPCATQPEGSSVKEYCLDERFQAGCAGDDVIVIRVALLGRMKYGRCIKQTGIGYVGCAADVTRPLDSLCSGRQYCDVSVVDPVLRQSNPCPDDVTWYLEASYDCVPVSHASCNGKDILIRARQDEGYLTSDVSGSVTSLQCNVQLRAEEGQRILLGAYNIMTSSRRHASQGQGQGAVCDKIAVVKDNKRNSDVILCPSDIRVSTIYESESSLMTLTWSAIKTVSPVLLTYKAVGCSTPGEVHLMGDEVIYSRDGDTLNVTCRSTGHLVWSLHCVDNTWVGEKSNCTTGSSLLNSQLKTTSFLTRGGVSVRGLALAILLGLLLGVVFGVTSLTLILVTFRRRKSQSSRNIKSRSAAAGQMLYERCDHVPSSSCLPPHHLDAHWLHSQQNTQRSISNTNTPRSQHLELELRESGD